MTRASRLHQLQELDLSLDRAQARLDEIRRRLTDDRAVALAQETLQQAERQARQEAEALRAAEHAAAQQQTKIQDAEGRLYGGSIHNPKELQDLQQDAEALRRHLNTLNERLLDAMLAQEQAEKDHQAAKAVVLRLEAERGEANADLVKEAGRLQSEVLRHALEREAMVAGVPSDDLALYTKLRQSSGGVAVTTVVDGSCGVCGLILSASGAQEARSSAVLTRCRQCGRVLYAG